MIRELRTQLDHCDDALKACKRSGIDTAVTYYERRITEINKEIAKIHPLDGFGGAEG